MYSRKKAGLLLLCAILLLSVAGCGGVRYNPSVSGIFLRRNYQVIGAEIETLDNSAYNTERYSADSLREFIENDVKNFNEKKAGLALAYQDDVQDKNVTTLPVAIREISYQENTARLLLDYSDPESYLEFNDRPLDGGVTNLMIGHVIDLIDSGTDFSQMQDPEGNAVSAEEIDRHSQDFIAVVTGGSHVQVEGKIRFVSAGVTITSDSEADTPAEGDSYIIFR
jgi:hypothetical protein